MKIFYNPRHAFHATTENVPGCAFAFRELPARADTIAATLRQFGELQIPPDKGIEPLRAVHSTDYLHYLETAFVQRHAIYHDNDPVVAEVFPLRNARITPTTFPAVAGWYAYDNAAPILAGTFNAAYFSAQCALAAADSVLQGEKNAYALCRPPGHHAARNYAGGYCYLNNAAIAARYLQNTTGANVAILDIDYHHGNGTQEIFYADSTVLYVSLHADPTHEYPYFWGSADEKGEGNGIGANCNFALPHGTTDDTYLAALGKALDKIGEFSPAFLVVSAGFDIMAGEPEATGAGFLITENGLAEISRRIASLNIPTVIVQEGGYNLQKLGDYAVTFLSAFRVP